SIAAGGISRREFVERASAVGLGLLATESVLASVDEKKKPKTAAAHGHHHHHIEKNPNQTNVNPYEEWRKAEGIPVYKDYGIANLRQLDLQPWKRLGGPGAYIDLKGGEGVN